MISEVARRHEQSCDMIIYFLAVCKHVWEYYRAVMTYQDI